MTPWRMTMAVALAAVVASCAAAPQQAGLPSDGVAGEAAPNPFRDTEAPPAGSSAPPAGFAGTSPTFGSQPGTPTIPSGWGPPGIEQ